MDNRRVTRTAKGQDEIANRRKTLKGKLRTVLFLIDPGKPVDAILEQIALIGAPADALAQLAAEGYIEETSGQGAGAIAAAPSFPEGAAAPDAEGVPLPPMSIEDEVASFRVAKAFMNDTIVDALGIRAFTFTLRLERCSTRDDLVALLPDYTEALLKKLERPAVRALVDRTRELLNAGRR
jgi:DNA-binding FrmR family transcriptional regulator